MMKRALLLASLVSVAACSSSDDAPLNVAEAKSALVRNTAPAVSTDDATTLANDNSAFALSAYAALAKGSTGNIFFSPYSISSALAMTYAGAKGQTATEMAAALHFTLPPERLHPAFDQVDLSLTTPAPGFTLHVANSMWGPSAATFEAPFLDTLAVNYGAGVFLQDFGNPGAAEQRINRWVSDQTNGKIHNLLVNAVRADTRLVLVDAVYFDADWSRQFDPTRTSPGTFDTDGGPITVPMMRGGELLATAGVHTDAYDAVELEYDGSAVMQIVMPKAGTMAAFESTLTPDELHTIMTSSPGGAVDLTMPKFSYSSDAIDLVPLLKGLGMNRAFSSGDADFSGIASGELWIGSVVQKAFVRVDEKGTEAAAATAVITGTKSAETPPAISITIDHPFFFTIRDQATNTILFAGRITDPTK